MRNGKIVAQLTFCGYPQGYAVEFDDGGREQFDTFALSEKIQNKTVYISNAKLVKFGGEYSDKYILRGVGVKLKDLPEVKLDKSLLTL